MTARDLDFPTEGGISKDFSREMEEGSMACSALTVLYAAYFLKRKPEWLEFAARVLRLHDAFCIRTCTAPLFRTLYLDELSAPLRVEAAGELTVICAVPVRVTAGRLVRSDENGLHIRPDADGIIGLTP